MPSQPLYGFFSHWCGDNRPEAVQIQRYYRSLSYCIRHLLSEYFQASQGVDSKPDPASDIAFHPCTRQGNLPCKGVYKYLVFLPCRLRILRFVLGEYTSIRFYEVEVHFF